MNAEEIKITGEFTNDPNVCRFIVDRPVLPDWTIHFKSREESQNSPIVDGLFAINGVSSVRVGGDSITITKEVATPWPEMARDIGKAIRGALTSGQPPVSEAALASIREAPLANLEEVIRDLFEEQINPALASHGGFVRLVKVEGRDLFLEMGGGCQGCAASKMTLKNGIENAVREAVPQVRQIVDVTDHSAGTKPYYK